MKDIADVAPGMMNASCPVGDVATAGQPEEEHLKSLAEAGYRTVLDLRTAEEDRGFDEAEAVRGAGMEYVSVPLAARPEAFTDDVFDRARELLGDPERRPVLVHCGSAARAAALVVPYLILDEGKSPGEAVEAASGVRNEDLTQRALRYAQTR